MIINNAILMQDDMIERKWPGSPTCYFYEPDEITSHLLFQAVYP